MPYCPFFLCRVDKKTTSARELFYPSTTVQNHAVTLLCLPLNVCLSIQATLLLVSPLSLACVALWKALLPPPFLPILMNVQLLPYTLPSVHLNTAPLCSSSPHPPLPRFPHSPPSLTPPPSLAVVSPALAEYQHAHEVQTALDTLTLDLGIVVCELQPQIQTHTQTQAYTICASFKTSSNDSQYLHSTSTFCGETRRRKRTSAYVHIQQKYKKNVGSPSKKGQ